MVVFGRGIRRMSKQFLNMVSIMTCRERLLLSITFPLICIIAGCGGSGGGDGEQSFSGRWVASTLFGSCEGTGSGDPIENILVIESTQNPSELLITLNPGTDEERATTTLINESGDGFRANFPDEDVTDSCDGFSSFEFSDTDFGGDYAEVKQISEFLCEIDGGTFFRHDEFCGAARR